VVSRTVTVKLADPVLLLVSVAEHVTVVVPIAKTLPDARLQIGVRAPLTRSDALTVKLTVAPLALVASTVMFAGTVTVGGVVSLTVTVNERLALLLWASVAEQFTVVVPSPKTLPDA